MTAPAVSVLVLSHRPHLLAECRASLEAQTYRDFQVLTSESIDGRPLWPGKWNALARAAEGQFLVWVCDDDRLTPTYLADTTAAAARAPEVAVIYTAQQLFGDRDEVYPAGAWTAAGFRHINPVLGLTALVRREAWPGFDDDLIYNDWGAYYEIFRAGGRGLRLDAPLLEYRYHAGMGSRHMDLREARRQLGRKYPELAL